MNEILVLFYSRDGSVKNLANIIARGINSVDGINARIRTLLNKNAISPKTDYDPMEVQFPAVTLKDLRECKGLALGSPVHFGNPASVVTEFWESTTPEWLTGTLTDKPACVFTSSGSMHGGQEACLLSLMLPLLHHGMLVMGLPYTDSRLMNTQSGGTPYGVSHVSGIDSIPELTNTEHTFAFEQGKRLANLVKQMFV